jgi:phospholipid transport system substrate-binding protein
VNPVQNPIPQTLLREAPMLRRFLPTAAVILIAGASAPALPAEADPDPALFIRDLGSQLQIVAEMPSAEQRRAEFRRLFHDDFDVPALGRFVLGRYARILTAPQQQEFLALFENYVVATYSERLSDYITGGVVPRVIGSRIDPDGAIVSSEFVGGSGPAGSGAVRVDWRLSRERDGAYRISDIIIDGLSMAANGRSELEGVAERNGEQPLAILAVMRQETINAMLR